MRKWRWLLLAAAMVGVTLLSGLHARADLWNDTRTSFATDEIVGLGKYALSTEKTKVPGFSISWEITQVGNNYRYLYTFAAGDGEGGVPMDVSHLILQVSDTFTYSDFVEISAATLKKDDLRTYSPAGKDINSNPNLPASIFGAKFELEETDDEDEEHKQYIEFVTTRAPMWGSFYVKSGNGTEAWNVGLETSSVGIEGFVAVPDTVTLIPEPALLQMGALAAFGVVGLRRLFRPA